MSAFYWFLDIFDTNFKVFSDFTKDLSELILSEIHIFNVELSCKVENLTPSFNFLIHIINFFCEPYFLFPRGIDINFLSFSYINTILITYNHLFYQSFVALKIVDITLKLLHCLSINLLAFYLHIDLVYVRLTLPFVLLYLLD